MLYMMWLSREANEIEQAVCVSSIDKTDKLHCSLSLNAKQ